MADRSVGGIVGYLRLDKSDWDAELTAAGTKADDLARKNPNIKVTASTADALAQLEAVAVATGKLQDAQAKVSVAQQKYNDIVGRSDVTDKQYLTTKNALLKATRDEETAQIRLASAYARVDDAASKAADSTSRANKNESFSANPLAIGAAALGPAVVPLAAAGAGALLGLAPLAATALLAFKGIETQLKSTTNAGSAFAQNVATIKSEVTGLEATAASGIMKAFGGDLGSITSQFGPLNDDVALYSSQLGKIAADVLPGLLALMHDLSPLFATMGDEVVKGAADFDKWASSTGAVTNFVAYVQTELPQVERTITTLATTVSHLLQGFAPLGSGVLTDITLFSRAINAIPISVLQALIPLATDAYLAFKVYQGLGPVGDTLDKVANSLRRFAGAETEASVAAEGADLSMSSLLGPVGAVAVGVGLLASTFLGSGGAAQAAKADIDSYTQSIEQDNYAIGTNTQQTLANKLVKDGAIDNANKLGISTQDVTNAIINGGPALTTMTSQLQAIVTAGTHYVTSGKSVSGGMDAQATAASQLLQILQGQNGEINTAVGDANTYKSVLASLNGTTNVAINSTQGLANAYQTLLTNGAAVASTAADGLTTATDAYSKSAGTAADKAALLGAVLVASQGDALSYAGAVSAGYAATQALITTFQQQAASTVSTSGTVNATNASVALDKVTAATSRLNAAQISAGGPQKSAASAASAASSVASASASLASANAALDKASKPVGGVSASMAFADTEKAAIDLNTGLINLKATGAAPLVQQLQGMQDAAEKAAEATYQHELATKGDSTALSDAQTIFESMTNGSLVDNAKQLGLTKDQAQKLADQYFTFDGKTVTTSVQSIGLDTINDTLTQIGELLAKLTGQTWVIPVTADVKAAQIAAVGTGSATAGHRAAGGSVAGAGSGTSDSILSWLSNGEYVMPADKAAMYRPMLDAMRSGVSLSSPGGRAAVSYQAAGGGVTVPPMHITLTMPDGRVLTQVVTEQQTYNNSRR